MKSSQVNCQFNEKSSSRLMLVFRCMLDGRIKEMSTSTYSHPSVCVYVSVPMLNNSWAMLCTPKQRLVTEIPLHTSSDSIYLHGYKHTRRHPQRQIYLTRVGVETGFTGTGSCKLSHPWSILYRSLKINIYSAPRFVLESHHVASPGSP